MKPSVYVETSVISYLTARPSSYVTAASRQQLTDKWWGQRDEYRLCISQLVIEEAAMGDERAARARLDSLVGLEILPITAAAQRLAELLVQRQVLPHAARADALHLAIAAVHRMEYLVTWNCRHLNHAQAKPGIREVCLEARTLAPELCSPEELLGEANDG